jgi:hypothetical protein
VVEQSVEQGHRGGVLGQERPQDSKGQWLAGEWRSPSKMRARTPVTTLVPPASGDLAAMPPLVSGLRRTGAGPESDKAVEGAGWP